jgi:hypothetical protein
MTSERFRELRRSFECYQAGLAPELDLSALCEEALNALGPLVALHETKLGGPERADGRERAR